MQPLIIIRILAFILLAAYPAGAQWVRWETSAGGNGHWYRPVPGFPGLTWTLADQLARDEGGYLATLASAAENAFVFNLVDAPQFWTRFNGSGPALGGFQQDGAVEPAGGWHWGTGEAWSYSNWLPGQPDNNPWGPPEDRLHFWGGGPRVATWNDIQRDDSNLGGYVVESDTAPRPRLSIPWVRWETSAGGNGHWYKAVRNTNGANWTQVNELAQAEGGYLATITSAAENAFVFSLINSPEFFQAIGGGSGPAIGGFQPEGSPEPDGGWTWVTGEAWGYTNWTPPTNGFPQMPDNAGGYPNENRLHFFSGAQGVPAPTWNDLPDWDTNLGGYLVESDTAPRAIAVPGLPSLGGYVMGSDITPRPHLSIHPGGEVCWPTVTNVHYQLQWAASVNSTNWINLGPVVVGTGATTAIPAPSTGEQQRFYRVRMSP